jgi:hypothetical protein
MPLGRRQTLKESSGWATTLIAKFRFSRESTKNRERDSPRFIN